jgi:hypothetical protein
VSDARISIGYAGRYMIAESYDRESGDYRIRGGSHPYTYKTFRGAAREIRNGGNDGLILLWDPSLLPVVIADEPVLKDPNLADRMGELEFCDRQIQLWADRADRVRAGERFDLALTFATQEDVDAVQ